MDGRSCSRHGQLDARPAFASSLRIPAARSDGGEVAYETSPRLHSRDRLRRPDADRGARSPQPRRGGDDRRKDHLGGSGDADGSDRWAPGGGDQRDDRDRQRDRGPRLPVRVRRRTRRGGRRQHRDPGPGYNGKRIGYACSGSVAAVLAGAGLWQPGSGVPNDAGVIRQLRQQKLIAPWRWYGPGRGHAQRRSRRAHLHERQRPLLRHLRSRRR
jgi:hypothetical protein